MVYDPIEDTLHSNDGWISIKDISDVEAINFVPHQFYEQKDLVTAKTEREAIEADYEKRKNEDSEKKAAKGKNKKDKSKDNEKTDENE